MSTSDWYFSVLDTEGCNFDRWDENKPLPFLVTWRNYAQDREPERSGSNSNEDATVQMSKKKMSELFRTNGLMFVHFSFRSRQLHLWERLRCGKWSWSGKERRLSFQPQQVYLHNFLGVIVPWAKGTNLLPNPSISSRRAWWKLPRFDRSGWSTLQRRQRAVSSVLYRLAVIFSWKENGFFMVDSANWVCNLKTKTKIGLFALSEFVNKSEFSFVSESRRRCGFQATYAVRPRIRSDRNVSLGERIHGHLALCKQKKACPEKTKPEMPGRKQDKNRKDCSIHCSQLSIWPIWMCQWWLHTRDVAMWCKE